MLKKNNTPDQTLNYNIFVVNIHLPGCVRENLDFLYCIFYMFFIYLKVNTLFIGSSPALATCETRQVLLAGVSGGFPGVLPFRPPIDWLFSMSEIILKGTLN